MMRPNDALFRLSRNIRHGSMYMMKMGPYFLMLTFFLVIIEFR